MPLALAQLLPLWLAGAHGCEGICQCTQLLPCVALGGEPAHRMQTFLREGRQLQRLSDLQPPAHASVAWWFRRAVCRSSAQLHPF